MRQSRVENVHYFILVKIEFLASIDLLIHRVPAVKAVATSGDRTLSYTVIFASDLCTKNCKRWSSPRPCGMILLIKQHERLEGPEKREFVVQMWMIVEAAKW